MCKLNESLKKGFILIFGAGLSQLITLTFLPFISRLYTPSNLGDFGLYSGICWIIGVIGTFQLEHLIIIPKSSIGALRILRCIFIYGFFVSALVVFLAFALLGSVGLSFKDIELFRNPFACAMLGITVLGIISNQGLRAWYIRKGCFTEIGIGSIILSLAIGATF